MSVQILDCTLRDGGYINDWNFNNSQIKEIFTALKAANIDIVECGYLNDKKGAPENSTLFNSTGTINTLLKKINFDSQLVAMINLGDFDIETLPPKDKTLLDGIRLAFHKKDFEKALKAARFIIDLGYSLYFQPMISKSYSDLEFLSLIKEANKLDIYAFYIVDSFGSMTLEEFQRYAIISSYNLNPNILLGYHSHNNMQLAFSNAISLCNNRAKRDVIIDASIYGMGRGAGNLNTELIADYLNQTLNASYNTIALLEIIDTFLASLMRNNPWGFSPAHYLSASLDCHPNYASFLVNKNTNHIVTLRNILEKIPNEKKFSFDQKLIESLYMNNLLEPKTVERGVLYIPSDKKVLLIASGKSTLEYKELLYEKSDNPDYILIALNHNPEISCDYYFFSNQKRFDEFKNSISINKIVITTNIRSNINLKTVLSFKDLSFIDKTFISNVAVLAINYLISQGIQEVEIAGLDGYKTNTDNYIYEEKSVVIDHRALSMENTIIKEALGLLKMDIVIEFITPSVFKKETDLRILGVIPARYKSSRFEGKPLCIIKNIPMIKRTYLQAKKSKLLTHLVVATDDNRIKEYCESEEIPVLLTSESCLTGTDRIAEIAMKEFYDLYVNIQGDEPIIDPASIDEIVDQYKEYGESYIAYNLYKVIQEIEEITSDTIIKTIVNEKDELMYMSRLGIPFNKSGNEPTFKKQVCVYGFTRKALSVFSSRDKTINEAFEDIEILRFIDMGYKVKMKETNVDSIAVDIPDDIKKVETFLSENGIE